MRPSVNPNSETIENVVAKLQQSHIELLKMMVDDFAGAGVHSQELYPLRALIGSAEKRSPEWFCQACNFLDATRRATSAKQDVFESLKDSAMHDHNGRRVALEEMFAQEEADSDVPLETVQMLRKEVEDLSSMAEMCATEGVHDVAAQLLARSMSLFCVLHDDDRTWSGSSGTPSFSKDGYSSKWVAARREVWKHRDALDPHVFTEVERFNLDIKEVRDAWKHAIARNIREVTDDGGDHEKEHKEEYLDKLLYRVLALKVILVQGLQPPWLHVVVRLIESDANHSDGFVGGPSWRQAGDAVVLEAFLALLRKARGKPSTWLRRMRAIESNQGRFDIESEDATSQKPPLVRKLDVTRLLQLASGNGRRAPTRH